MLKAKELFTHSTTYSLKYDFSSKIVCGHCNSTYVRRQGTKRKDGTAPIYWKCYQQVDEKDFCKESKFIREDVLKSMFVELYNLIVKNKHKTKDKLLNAIKSTLKEENYQKEIDKLNIELDKYNSKLSKLVDMQLDGIIDKEIFDSIVERIILGEIDENGNSNPDVVRFILKTGTEYKCENNGIDTSVSFGSYKRFSSNLSNRNPCIKSKSKKKYRKISKFILL